ncbi:hypothetical protein [Tenacibaculum sp. C7A-26P2]|uniref:hypothetical protein n=1 Tax=Tenacibaculum sp. C7A-26P2 TaxID=3447504 RepID=UPI003F829503
MNIKKTISLRLLALAIAGTTVLSSCDSNEQNFSEELEVANSSQFSSLKSLLPPGTSSKVLNSKSDITGSGPIYLIQDKGAETASLAELCQEQGVDYLVKASNKVEKEALKSTMVAYAGSNKNNSNLYVLSYEEPVQGRKSIFYEEGDDKSVSSKGMDEESVSISSFTVNEISNEISKELSKLSGKNALNATRNKSTAFDKYQHEASYFIDTKSLKYIVVVKIAKGITNDTKDSGYGIHVEYLPQSGVVHKRARFGDLWKNPDYSIWYPSYGMKYYQELTDLITAVTFVTELTGPSQAIIKDHSPVAKISGSVSRTRQNPSYSFTIGGGLDASVSADGPSLGANLNGSYTYNSGSLSSTITSEDVKHLVNQEPNGLKHGVQYLQDYVAGQRYLKEHPRTPLGSYDLRDNTIILGGLNKPLGMFASETHDELFIADMQSLPGMSRSNTNPNAMVNYFIADHNVPSNGVVKVKAKIYLDYMDAKAGQTPYEYWNVDHPRYSIEATFWKHSAPAHDFEINLKKLGN